MTENEAIEELKYDCNELGKAIPCDTSWGESFENAYAMAINALEEVRQYRKHGVTVESTLDNMCDLAAAENLIEEYRAIGTPEECRKSVDICKAMAERRISLQNMEDYMKFEDECVKRGFTFGRLIDADKFKGKVIASHTGSGVIKLIAIDEVPTAYDPDKVVE